MSQASPLVFLVGAGPGDPGLLTLRAAECLSQADFVIYDRLVPPQMLDHAPVHAERLCVTDLPGHHPERAPQVSALTIAAARQGKRVVRLKGGDPLVFGRGGEEALALREAGIGYEIVPGVTAALGAAACAGIPLTHRAHASAIAIVTGHEDPDKPESVLDWHAIARFPGTLVIYMGLARLPQIVQALLENGKSPSTPAAVIERGSTSDQRTVEAPLDKLPSAVAAASVQAPALVVIGSVVSLRSALAWFEQRPLFGKSVLVTRPRHQAAPLTRRLEQLGASVYLLPAVDVCEPPDWAPVDAALTDLDHYQWIVFTSSNGVHAFIHRLRQLGRDLRALGGLKFATIGPSTALALRGYHLDPDFIPEEFRSESLAAGLIDRVRGQRVLLARADRGRELLRDELHAIAQVNQIAVYSQVDSVDTASPGFERLRNGKLDYVTLTSSNIVRALVRSLDASMRVRIASGEVKLVSISPVTSATSRELGLPVAAEAVEYTSSGVVDAILGLAKQK